MQIDLYETEQGQWSRPAPMEGQMRVALPRRRHLLQGDHSRPLLDGVFANFPQAFEEASMGGSGTCTNDRRLSSAWAMDGRVLTARYGHKILHGHS